MNRGCLQPEDALLNNPQQLPTPHPKLRLSIDIRSAGLIPRFTLSLVSAGFKVPWRCLTWPPRNLTKPTKLDKIHETVSGAASEASHRHRKRECDVHSLQPYTTHFSQMSYPANRQKASVQLRASPPKIESTTGLHTSRPRLVPHRHQSCHVCSHPLSCLFHASFRIASYHILYNAENACSTSNHDKPRLQPLGTFLEIRVELTAFSVTTSCSPEPG